MTKGVMQVFARSAALAAAVLSLAAGVAAARDAPAHAPRSDVAEPPGYRLDDYRAPVPATVAGGTAIDTRGAERLWREGRAIFVDVLPAPRRPAQLRADALWKPVPRRDVPGSLWLPGVGHGALRAEDEDYFRRNLVRATGGDKKAALVFYCLADCWMSWNAAKRAAAWGYGRVYWYRDGTTGWEAAHLPEQEARPAEGRP